MKQTGRGGRSLPLLVVTGLMVVPLAGCGGDEPAATPAAPPPVDSQLPPAGAEGEPVATSAAAGPDACALVSKQEAEQLAGTKLEDAVPVRETCTYTGPVTGPTAQVEVFVGDGAKKFLDVERSLGHELRPLSGVADEAYVSAEAAFVNRAGRWVAVRLVRLNDPAENRAPLERVARTVAGRI
ncbi:hypothetical protein AB0873_08360 [Micromonospora sp. NPDC047707]|uniref:hypothetical protein n=1 Tax=unclassified Micromonospora TaxID=2617518 RepID=UPI003452BE70